VCEVGGPVGPRAEDPFDVVASGDGEAVRLGEVEAGSAVGAEARGAAALPAVPPAHRLPADGVGAEPVLLGDGARDGRRRVGEVRGQTGIDQAEAVPGVRAHLRPRQETSQAEYVRNGQATLDVLRREVILPDRTVPLPPREYMLLRHLMGKSGQVCTREELLRDVWGYNFAADSNVVDKYVSRLRSKLPEGLIETVRHVGYCYCAV